MDFPTVVDSQYVEISQHYPHLKSSDANSPAFGGFWFFAFNYLVNTVTKLFKL